MLKRQCLRFCRLRPTSAFNWGFMDSTLLPPRTYLFSSLHGSGASNTNVASGSYMCAGMGCRKVFNGTLRNVLPLKVEGFFGFDKRVDSGALRNRSGGSVFALRPQSVQNLGIGLQHCRDSDKATSQEGSHPGNPIDFSYHPKFEKTVVAVDVDEVLGNFVSALNKFIADRYSLNHSVSEYHVYEFFKIWKCSRDEADIRVHEFFKTPYFKTGIHPIPGAREALDKLSKVCNLCVVTSRQNTIKDHTIGWLETHYPGLFRDMHFGNHFALDGESRRKSDICRSVGAKYLIDDNPRYAIECAEAGIRVLLFDYENSYPWCKSDEVDQHPLVTRVCNWEEVKQQLISWIAT